MDTGPPPFSDVDPGSPHARSISCLAGLDVVGGVGGGRFDPTAAVTRGQVASLLARVLTAAEFDLAPGPNAFGDDDGSVHEDAIDALTAVGVIQGVRPGVFAPEQGVTRAQMAALVRRLVELVEGQALPVGPDAFTDDDDSEHEAAIDAVAAAGLVRGRSDGTFGPGEPVRRDQAASILAAALARLR